MIFKIFLVLILLIASFVFPNIHAQQTTDPCGTTTFDCYQESGFRLNSDPVICMGLPSDRNVVDKMRAYTEDAVMNWQNLLNAKSDPSNPLWNLQLIPTATSDICNISIQFLPKPTPDQEAYMTDAVGTTTWFSDNTAKIVIYYNTLSVDENGSYYFLDSLAPDYQIQWAIKHELGHAFGLGHYMMTDDEKQSWLSGFTATPSIMVTAVPPSFSVTGSIVTYHPDITYNDIAHLKSLYNNNGFGGDAQTRPQQISISTDKQIYYYGDHVIITIDVSKVTGANATLTLVTRGSQTEPVPIPVIISELHGTITSLALDETNSPTGTVDATLSYDGQTATTSFQIAGQNPSSVSPQDQINSTMPTTTQPTQTPTVPQNQVPPIPQPTWHPNPTIDITASERAQANDWANGLLGDDAFVDFLQWLNFVKEIQFLQPDNYTYSHTSIPSWIKQDTKLWSKGDVSDNDYLAILQYAIDDKIITLNTEMIGAK